MKKYFCLFANSGEFEIPSTKGNLIFFNNFFDHYDLKKIKKLNIYSVYLNNDMLSFYRNINYIYYFLKIKKITIKNLYVSNDNQLNYINKFSNEYPIQLKILNLKNNKNLRTGHLILNKLLKDKQKILIYGFNNFDNNSLFQKLKFEFGKKFHYHRKEYNHINKLVLNKNINQGILKKTKLVKFFGKINLYYELLFILKLFRSFIYYKLKI